METYTFLREFADSWFLVVLFGFFIGVWIFAFWPSLQPARDDAASIPLRDDKAKCTGSCESCKAKFDFMKGLENG
ncbi:MAG: cbb3-type cytochrome c oxidase subunit 3 [Rhodobacteraceae bacterium]|nr:cbb3-type cytochrome c oxidase subunit 3 [Paracoccaceae bacterium]